MNRPSESSLKKIHPPLVRRVSEQLRKEEEPQAEREAVATVPGAVGPTYCDDCQCIVKSPQEALDHYQRRHDLRIVDAPCH